VPSSHDNPGPLPADGQFVQVWRPPVARWTAEPKHLTPPRIRSRRARLAEEARDKSRRVLNVVVAGLSLVLLSPLFLLIALSVRLSSPGPVFFTQERVGLDQRRRSRDRRARSRAGPDRRGSDAGGELFTMYKFRTMYVSDGPEQQVWAQENDPRITPVGRVLRAFRLDELPQLWNVLLGHMNIVGPRPEQPEIFQELRSELADYQRRQHVLPGITGWAQINNGYDQTFRDVERKVEFDLEYLERRSAVEDLKILVFTVPVVLRRKGFH
jgi:lipopolysaccharide/colanic/teichoic acid biosynthesis glycosyltransferase